MVRARGSDRVIQGIHQHRKGSNQLSDTTDGSMYVLEVGFHLPLHPFFYHLLDEYKIALGQLSSFSWGSRRWCRLLMVTVGANNRLVSDANIIPVVEENLKESPSLSKEIDEYMLVQSFMQNVRGGPFGTSIREGSASSRKKQKTIAGAANIILSSEDEGILARELRRKKEKDCAVTLGDVATTTIVPPTVPSPPVSPPWVNYQLKAYLKFPYCPTKVSKSKILASCYSTISASWKTTALLLTYDTVGLTKPICLMKAEMSFPE
ncbi:hypothetical protein PVK06_001502 [Gossypium arboreum]|uniref:Uncharacterized protein n=1 Tax=Gossypium arboreum TaxID=29729 RepID=A0ABR0R284_GOSAR|nr:hypothetical protein PVK06_001502 [Gossypium arboreum]